MPTTTNFGWTYPANTDLVTNGATQMGTIATSIDTTVWARTRPAYGEWTASQGMLAGWQTIPLTTELLDTDTFATAGATSITIPANMAGLYTCILRVNLGVTQSLSGELAVRWTTAAYGTKYDIMPFSTNATYFLAPSTTNRMAMTATQRLAVGDTVSFHQRGGTSASATQEMWIERTGM